MKTRIDLSHGGSRDTNIPIFTYFHFDRKMKITVFIKWNGS